MKPQELIDLVVVSTTMENGCRFVHVKIPNVGIVKFIQHNPKLHPGCGCSRKVAKGEDIIWGICDDKYLYKVTKTKIEELESLQ